MLNFRNFSFLGGAVALQTPSKSASLQVTKPKNEIKFLCTTPIFRVNPPPKKKTNILHNTMRILIGDRLFYNL